MSDAAAFVARSTLDSQASTDTDAWKIMDVKLSTNADAREWLAQFLRDDGQTPPGSQGSPVPTHPGGLDLPDSAVVHVDIADCINITASTRTYRGLLDLLGRAVPVSVIAWVPSASPVARSNPPHRVHAMSSLRDPNILPILGEGRFKPFRKADVVPDLGCTDLRTYLTNHPDADKRRLIIQVAEGLRYFHYQVSVVHGLLGPGFVHVNDCGDVALDNPVTISEYQASVDSGRILADNGPLPYSAPEIVLADAQDSARPWTRHSDMYAFGMLVYEILSGREPWADAKMVDIFRYIVSGRVLRRPEGGTIDDSMWNLCTACWNQNPADRPGIANVLAGLRSDTPPTRWRPDAVVEGDRWAHFERLSLVEEARYATPTELEVEIDGSLVTIVIPKQETTAGAFGTVVRGYAYHAAGSVKGYALKTCRGKAIMPREYEIWRSLSHRKILPLLGVVEKNLSGSRERVFVSSYFQNGNLTEYLESKRSNGTVLRLITDVATGLRYLHDEKAVVHGDIKPENILIDEHGSAVLADFGLSTYVAPGRQETPLDVRQVYTLTYCAPEVLDDTAEDPSSPGFIRSKTKMSDMFAYAVLLYQTYAGGLGKSQRDRIQLMLDMYEGRFPQRPLSQYPVLCDDLWSICTRCWAKVPIARPPIATVLQEIRRLRRSPTRQLTVTVQPA